MIFKQYYLGCLAHASYLIADETTKVAAIVDPQRDIAQYLDDAAAAGLSIRHVFLTHFHADFLAGHIELRNRTGATIHMGARAQAEFAVEHHRDGDVVEFGDVRLKILETPGHTPEGISILVFDQAGAPEVPNAVLTGDTLFIGDVGRPDLLASIGVTADELADMLYDSIQRLKTLPDATLVYPAHGAGSLCGKSLSKETVSTIGEQKLFNYALQPMTREAFKEIVTEDQPEAPAYFVHDAILNRKERPDLDQTMGTSLQGMTVDEVLQAARAGAQLLDVRESIDFEGAHLAGALHVDLKGKYATWCGTLLDKSLPIIVIADEGDENEAVMRLGRIGLDNVAGYLRGGMRALETRPELVRKIERITAPALSRQLEAPRPPVIVDVRSEAEHRRGGIEGSLNIPLPHLTERIAGLPKDRTIVVHCEGGYRSAIAASVLEKNGVTNLLDLVGGIKAWTASGLATTADDSCAAGRPCSP